MGSRIRPSSAPKLGFARPPNRTLHRNFPVRRPGPTLTLCADVGILWDGEFMAFYERVPWPAVGVLMVMPYDPELHAVGSKGRQGKCLWSDHDVDARWSAVWRGERWPVCDTDLAALARAELGAMESKPSVDAVDLATRFDQHVMAEVVRLQKHGYNPTQFRGMVQASGAVAATKQLLGDPRHTSYGFEKLWEMGELESSVEFAVCLPWFRELFSDDEADEAERRLLLHDFPVDDRVAVAVAQPPVWTLRK
jgi:hypothetical protein